MNATTLPTFGVPTGRITRESLDALYATGHWLHARERYIDAAPLFRAMVLCAPHDERGYLALGACHEGMGQPAIALEIYGVATVNATLAPRCHLARARLLLESGHPEEAARSFAEAARIARETEDEELQRVVACEGERETSCAGVARFQESVR